MRIFAFIASIIAYAALSSPTPDAMGLGEFFVIALLFIALFHIKTINAALAHTLPSPLGFHRVFVLWMVSVPLFMGVINANAPQDIIRDIIPVALLALPIIMPRIDTRYFIITLSIAGSLFAARYLFFAMPNMLQIGLSPAHDSLLYLANSPLVPFAAIIGFSQLFAVDKCPLIFRFLALLLFTLTIISMGLMVQRAPLILTIMGCMALIGVRTAHAPTRTTIIATLLLILCLPLIGFVIQIYDGFVDKTLMVGTNNRLDEFMAVLSHSNLLGQGWGTEWQSPAVADYWVRYTHNMATYYWLKAGIIGAILSLIFIYLWLREAIILTRHNLAIGLAIIIPISIHFFLYTGYKTFDISLLLALIILCKRDHHPS
jgi:hypothetical protein